MKIIETIWSLIMKIHKIIFSYDLTDNRKDYNLYDDSNHKIILIRNEKDNELLINQLKNENKKRVLIIHYTTGDNNQKDKIESLKDKNWKWNS